MDLVESRQNPLVARCRRLARGRSADDRAWLLDGWHLVEEGLAAGLEFECIAMATSAHAAADKAGLVERAQAAGARLVLVTPHVLEAMSPVREPGGVMALARPREWDVADTLRPTPAFGLVACGVQDPGNLGAVIRAADAAGATGVIAAGTSADPGAWKALRGAMGSAFRLPVVRVADTARVLGDLAAQGVTIVATVAREAPSIYDTDLRGPTACLLGSEGSGLAADVLALAHRRVTIPMRDGVDSLNVATAAAVIAYEAWRQRRAG